jgi:uncharacterized membrane protein
LGGGIDRVIGIQIIATSAALSSDPVLEAPHSIAHCPSWLVNGLEIVQTTSDLVGMAAISIALVVAAVRWIILELSLIRTRGRIVDRWLGIRDIRVFLGHYILLGLEFMIVSDIIHSFLQPDLQSLSQLGILVVIRTMIGFFLGKELEAAAHEEPPQSSPKP